MTISRTSIVFLIALGLFAASVGCKPGPSEMPVLSGLTMAGPAELAPGATGNYAAIASYSDGSTRDVTGQASWLPALGWVKWTSPGVAVAEATAGESELRVFYKENWNGIPHQFTAVKAVLVLPPGTFKVSGRVGTSGATGNSIWVTVLSGNLAGTSVRGGGTGYRIYGAAGPTELEATAGDHVTARKELNVTGHTVHDFQLAPIFSGADVSGVWTLTLVDPAPSCPPGFPQAARGRAYTLTITQNGRNLALHLARPGLSVAGAGSMSGAVAGNQVTLAFLFLRNEYTGEILNFNILDRLSATETLSWEATLAGTHTGDEITATTSGTIIYTNAPNAPPAWQCTASGHVFTVRR